jgi:hypothetical protein
MRTDWVGLEEVTSEMVDILLSLAFKNEASEHLYTRSDSVDSNRFIQKVLLLRIRSVSMIDKRAAACRALLVCLV